MTEKKRFKNSYEKANAAKEAIKGFTVVELLVSMTLFLIVIGAVSGVFIQVLKTQRIAAALITVNNNASLALEQMAREIRTGFDFCPTDGNDDCSSSKLVFTNALNENVVYNLENGTLVRAVNALNEPITAEDVEINNLTFLVSGELPDDDLQPLITISIAVGGRNPTLQGAGIRTNLQTSISSRVPEEGP